MFSKRSPFCIVLDIMQVYLTGNQFYQHCYIKTRYIVMTYLTTFDVYFKTIILYHNAGALFYNLNCVILRNSNVIGWSRVIFHQYLLCWNSGRSAVEYDTISVEICLKYTVVWWYSIFITWSSCIWQAGVRWWWNCLYILLTSDSWKRNEEKPSMNNKDLTISRLVD